MILLGHWVLIYMEGVGKRVVDRGGDILVLDGRRVFRKEVLECLG